MLTYLDKNRNRVVLPYFIWIERKVRYVVISNTPIVLQNAAVLLE